MATRATLYLDDDVLERARRHTGDRGLSRFVSEVLAEKLDALARHQIAESMREGYVATRDDRDALNADWQAIDGERWPE
ncbi:MAG: hypothetical protein AVDCRST_MAG77-2355 [uncultured Chloroflexi bacterium]|uniref:CopG family transcriptional regulator n=1 Tax=uncultured Chloroflexota bacterium TaxID=166587 RepID=A0A6J4IM02_9CHLR|nr:MAG: hypothetical protein AVDCRST_MAG77-2355 [uncultured Chloroflexota bacterium]